MSVAVLKADNELGYWEYSVLTEDGEWNLQFSRGEKAGPPHTDRDDLFFLHLTIRREGEDFFSTWEQKTTPFLTHAELNGMIASATVANFARWYTGSALAHEIDYQKKQIFEALQVLGMAIEGLDDVLFMSDQPMLPPEDRIPAEVCKRVGPYGDATHRMYLDLYDYGMATTTPEWREAVLGDAEPAPHSWGCDHDHEHE